MRTHATIVALLFTANANAGNPPFHFEGSGKLASGAPYQVTVNEKQFARKPGGVPDDGSMWGIDGGFCSNVVADFGVVFDGKPAYIGRKFYSDICDLGSVTPLERDGKFILNTNKHKQKDINTNKTTSTQTKRHQHKQNDINTNNNTNKRTSITL